MSARAGNFCSSNPTSNTSAQTKCEPHKFSSPLSESQLEAAIEAAKQRMCAAPTRDGKLEHWREMCRLIDQRTPHRVRFMERMRGLR